MIEAGPSPRFSWRTGCFERCNALGSRADSERDFGSFVNLGFFVPHDTGNIQIARINLNRHGSDSRTVALVPSEAACSSRLPPKAFSILWYALAICANLRKKGVFAIYSIGLQPLPQKQARGIQKNVVYSLHAPLRDRSLNVFLVLCSWVPNSEFLQITPFLAVPPPPCRSISLPLPCFLAATSRLSLPLSLALC